MKLIFVITIFLFLSEHLKAHELKINISKLKKGKIGIVIFDSEDGFPKEANKAIFKAFKDPSEFPLILKFTDGKYAISIFQDSNNNTKLDTNFLGIPKEDFGFSNNKIGLFGPPSFKESSIELFSDKSIEIELKGF